LSGFAAAMADYTVLRLEIRGRVQGVGYRASMAEQAWRLGIRGWVRNRHDGSVEAVVAGTPQAVEQIVAWARRGPRAAAVSELRTFASEGVFDRFEQRPSA
jgi:acylphosphatase